MKVHVALGALLVMIAAPVVASSHDRAAAFGASAPVEAVEPLMVEAVVSPPRRDVDPSRAPANPSALAPSAAAPSLGAARERSAPPEASELTISIDCDGTSCAVSSGLAVEVISAPR